jgi:hypothetical protein
MSSGVSYTCFHLLGVLGAVDLCREEGYVVAIAMQVLEELTR